MVQNTELLYRKISRMLADQIRNKAFLPGDRLPSIRGLSKKMNVSAGTVQQAYADLEDRGLAVPRKRRGYFVTQPAPIPPPDTEFLPSRPEPVTVLDTAITVMGSAARKDLLQMGSAVPSIDGPGVGQLHREMKRQALRVPNYEEDPRGYLPLRRQLARRCLDAGSPVHPDEIVVTAGCQEALTLALRSITSPGDTVVVESPAYYGLLQALECLGLKALELPVSPVRGIDIPQLDATLTNWPVKGIVLTPAFSNPSGYLCPESQKQEIVRLISKHDIPLIEDDVFANLPFSGPRPRSIQSYDRDGRVILCGSISKTLCPDLRIGWMVAGRYAETVRNLKFISTLCAPCHPQFALSAFLSTSRYERHLRSGEICSPTGRFKNYIRLNYAVVQGDELASAVKALGRLMI